MRRKKITACILVAVLLIGALYIVQRLLVPKYQTGIVEGSMVEEYYKDRSDHEVLFVGDCEVYENFSTIELWRKYGITSYIRGSAQQLTWQSYYLLEDALKHETPKVVVFNVLALKYNEPQSEAYNRMSIDGMKWSMSKVNDIKASMTDEENFVDYIFPLLRYHSRWSELTKDDVKHIFSKDKVTHNGYYMRVDTKPQQEFPDPTPLTDYKLGDKAMGYLQKMTDLCKEKGVKLVLIKSPTEYPYWYEQWDEQVQQFADENDELMRYIMQLKRQGRIELIVISQNVKESMKGNADLDFANVVLFQHGTPAATEEISKALFGTYQYHKPMPNAVKPPALLFTFQRAVNWQIQSEERLRVRSEDLSARPGIFGRQSDYLAVKTTANNNIYFIHTADFLKNTGYGLTVV